MDNNGQSEEFNTLIQGVMPVAEKMLGELGAFLPYAAVLYHDGEIKHLTVEPDSGSHDVHEIVTALERTLFALISDKDEKLTATALCMDIKMRTNMDEEDVAVEGIYHNVSDKKTSPNQDAEAKEHADENVDCIMLRLESVDGEALDAFRPYAIDHSGHVRFSRIFATKSDPKNFK